MLRIIRGRGCFYFPSVLPLQRGWGYFWFDGKQVLDRVAHVEVAVKSLNGNLRFMIMF